MTLKNVDLHLYRSITDAAKNNEYSPDTLELQANNLYVPVFVYGNEMDQFSEAHLTLGGLKLGIGRTFDRNFVMVKDTNWNRPMVFNHREHVPNAAAVYGQVFLVQPEAIFSLDDYHERGAYSRRFRRSIIHFSPEQIGERDKKWLNASCFMYTYIFDAFKEAIKEQKGFDPIRLVMDNHGNHGSKVIYRWFDNDDQPNRDRQKKNRMVMQDVSEAQRRAKSVDAVREKHLAEQASNAMLNTAAVTTATAARIKLPPM